MSAEQHTFEVVVQIDFAAWRAEYGTDETDAEIVRAVAGRLLYADVGDRAVANPVAAKHRPEVTDTDRLRFLTLRLFGQGDEDVRAARDAGRL